MLPVETGSEGKIVRRCQKKKEDQNARNDIERYNARCCYNVPIDERKNVTMRISSGEQISWIRRPNMEKVE